MYERCVMSECELNLFTCKSLWIKYVIIIMYKSMIMFTADKWLVYNWWIN